MIVAALREAVLAKRGQQHSARPTRIASIRSGRAARKIFPISRYSFIFLC